MFYIVHMYVFLYTHLHTKTRSVEDPIYLGVPMQITRYFHYNIVFVVHYINDHGKVFFYCSCLLYR